MKKLLFLIILFLYTSASSLNGEIINYTFCQKYLSRQNTYNYFNTPLQKDNDYIELFGKKKNDLVSFSKTLNDYIIHGNIDQLCLNISDKDFRFYEDSGISENISGEIKKQLKLHKGFYYYFLFDSEKKYQGVKDLSIPEGRYLDIRKYLQCYKDKLIWRAFYNKNQDNYEICFSIPDWVIQEFEFFRYIIKEENQKFVIIGF